MKLLPTARRRLGSIRVRLTLWYVLILGVVLFAFSTVIYTSQAQNLHDEMETRLRTEGQSLALAYNAAAQKVQLSTDSKSLETQIPDQLTDKQVQLSPGAIMLVVDTNGTVVQHLGNVGSADLKGLLMMSLEAAKPSSRSAQQIEQTMQKLKQEAGPDVKQKVADLTNMLSSLSSTGESYFPFTLRGDVAALDPKALSGDYLFYTTPLVSGGQSVGTLAVGEPRQDEPQLQALLFTLMFAAPATLLLAAGGGYWLATRAMRPVRSITRTAQRIGEGDLHSRLHLSGHDELAELASTFDRMLDRIEGAFSKQRRFTADASHELRTPLTIVDLEVEHVLSAARTPEEYRRALRIVEAENKYMARLVNDLLLLARADAGQTALQKERLDLSDLALDVVERLEPLARQSGLALATGALPEVWVEGDRRYLTQMLSNLVENAIKYTRGYGTQVLVETGSEAVVDPGARAWVRVEDDGPGIDAQHLPHLFERFYRVDAARSHNDESAEQSGEAGGSGLGLSIVQWVVEAHGGEVRVQSEVGKGSEFEAVLKKL